MKTKLLSLLFTMMLVLAVFVSCQPGDSGAGGGGGNGGNGGGNNDVVIPEGAPEYNVTWDKTELKYALNTTQNENFVSGCRRYYAGQTTGGEQVIDGLVADRNAAAAKQANVSVRYDYDSYSEGWGGNIEKLIANNLTPSSQTPDIFANGVYDITSAALRDTFANLLRDDKVNWFRFTESDYGPAQPGYEPVNFFDSTEGEGYFFEYMKSLSLSDDKLFVLASDYCTDLVRTFLIVPMNVEMMQALVGTDANGQNNSYTGDMQQVSDFYDLVWRTPNRVLTNEKYGEGFTYNVVAHYATKVYEAASDPTDILSGKNAFVSTTTGGTMPSGILYTTSLEIISKTPNGDGTYTYAYDADAADLNEFATNLRNLFRTNGIVATSHTTTVGTGNYTSETYAISSNFAANKILFGGVAELGSLDTEVYQKMRTEGKKLGFGVLPVPLYRSVDKEGNPEEYRTMVHNEAKIISIAKSTQKFTECSAYLDYLSRMSADILSEYYDVQLVSSVDGFAGEFNVQMLAYIRNHVRNCFDKTYEDAIANMMLSEDENALSTYRLHLIIARSNYVSENIASGYEATAASKEARLRDAVATWNSFQDVFTQQ